MHAESWTVMAAVLQADSCFSSQNTSQAAVARPSSLSLLASSSALTMSVTHVVTWTVDTLVMHAPYSAVMSEAMQPRNCVWSGSAKHVM